MVTRPHQATVRPHDRTAYAVRPLLAKAALSCVSHQASKTYTKQRLVIARLHIDLRLRLDAVVHDERQRVTVTPGRNSPMCAIREQQNDLGFLGHFNIVAKLVPQIRKAKVMRRWQDPEQIAGIALQHDCLG